ncbi:MAG: ABC transporter permease [Gemmatimonadetes bacterium]|jgi:peptide/nickel transport system permease protein|nr:ABC transporter permease [Gemmatimonadota bacterium]
MIPFLFRRLLQGLAILFMVATVTFALIHAAPGEPFAAQLEDARFTPEMSATLRRQYGLDAPLTTQYARFLTQLVRGDLGNSLSQHQPVRAILAQALPRTLVLMSAALAAGFALGVVTGAAQAARAGTRLDRVAGRISVALSALPDFWLALALMLVFAMRLRWFPVSGMFDQTMHEYMSPMGKLRDVAWHLVLPATTLALIIGAVVARHQRQALVDILPEDFVRSARAKGVRERTVVMRHALRNALLPTITLLGLALPALVGGAVIIENIFGWPGMGRVALDAIAARDYPVVLGTTMVGSLLVVLGSLFADLLSAVVDPRLRRG